MKELSKELVTASDSLDSEAKDIVQKLVKTNDAQEIQDLAGLFNITNTKKNAIRSMKMGELWDYASDELLKRVSENPSLACNEDLMRYIALAESGMDRASKTLGGVDVSPVIQINQQNNTVNIGEGTELSREDRLKVLDIVNGILGKVKAGTLNPNMEIKEDTPVLNNEENSSEENKDE